MYICISFSIFVFVFLFALIQTQNRATKRCLNCNEEHISGAKKCRACLGQRKTDKTDKEDKRIENMKPPNASKQFDKLKYWVRGNCMNDKPHRQDPG